MSKLKWVSILVTPDNKVALQAITENLYQFSDVALTYDIKDNCYTFCDRISNSGVDIVLDSFELLPQILTLYSLGLDTQFIRESLNIPIREEDYA